MQTAHSRFDINFSTPTRVFSTPPQPHRKRGDQIPNPPPRQHDGHAAQAAEEVEHQDEAQAGVVDAGLHGNGPGVGLGQTEQPSL